MDSVFILAGSIGILVFLYMFLFPDLWVSETKLGLRRLEGRLLDLEPANPAEQEMIHLLLLSIGSNIERLRANALMSHWLYMILASARFKGIDFGRTARRVNELSPLCGDRINRLRGEFEALMWHFFVKDSVIFRAYVSIVQVRMALAHNAKRIASGRRFIYSAPMQGLTQS